MAVAAYIESHQASDPTRKQHPAAIKMLFDWLVTGQLIAVNPAAAGRGPKHVVKKGKSRATNSTRCPPTTMPISTCMNTSKRPGSPATAKPPCSGRPPAGRGR